MADNSRSIQRRKAAMRGEPTPEFDKKELKLLTDEEIDFLPEVDLHTAYSSHISEFRAVAKAQAELTAREIFKNVSAFDIDSEGRAVIRMPLEDWQQLRKQVEG